MFAKILSVILAFFMSFGSNISGFFATIGQNPKDVTSISVSNPQLNVNSDESNLQSSISYAAKIKNKVQGTYTDTERNGYEMKNSEIVFTHNLTTKKTATLASIDGGNYVENSFMTFYLDKMGVKHYFEYSTTSGRVNTIRLGEYYYDVNVRDFDSGNYKIDKEYHVYGDKLHAQYSILAKKATKALGGFGSEIKIPVSNVESLCIKDANGNHSSIGEADVSSTEFAAFVIKGVGTVGFIVPSDGSTASLTVEKSGKNYVITQLAAFEEGTGLNNYNEEGGYDLNKATFGFRIYTDSTNNFDGVTAAAYEERNPLTNISIGENNAECENAGYDALRGCYTFTNIGPAGFQVAYDNYNLQYKMPVKIMGDDIDRKIYIRFFGSSGCLEAGALLDDSNTLAPIDVEICKNFQGDGGEDFYSAKDYKYGDAFAPLCIEANKSTGFTMLHLYQNWGCFPLKQISSIEFHVSYYHLSTGCTESNCIAPYYVFEKDGWTLPDFRCRSGIIWETQPQFNSVGILKLLVDKTSGSEKYGEFTGSVIDSCGQAYADVTDSYVSDNGVYTYSTRHVEFPSTDENRTFYTLKIDFNEDVTYSDFANDISLYSFDGRFVAFNKAYYLGDDNTVKSESALTDGKTVTHVLGTDRPFFGFCDATDATEAQVDAHFGTNMAVLLRDCEIISEGKEIEAPFVVSYSGTEEDTLSDLSLDMKNVTFRKGDSITVNLILMPWGVGKEDTFENVLNVRDENKLTVKAKTGTVVEDSIVPAVKAENGVAEFTVKGCKNNVAVRIDGFKSMKKPTIYKVTEQGLEVYDNSVHGYDGYSIRTNSDGTYSVSFVYNCEDTNAEYSFLVMDGNTRK